MPETHPSRPARLTRVAVVLAGGTGTRVGLATPKQLLTIAGKPIIEHTIARLQESPTIDEVLVMMALTATRGSLLLFTSSSYTRIRAGYSLCSSVKAAVVNFTQALADEWQKAASGSTASIPNYRHTDLRERSFGAERPDTLLAAEKVARTALEVRVVDLTGHVIDVRRHDHNM